MSTLPVWLTSASAILVAFLGLIGVVRTARVARAANERTAALEGIRTQLDARDELIKSWREDALQLRRLRDDDEQRHARKLGELEGRVDSLARDLDQERRGRAEVERRVNELVGWARQVVPVMRRREIDFPPPPPGVADTDPGLPVLGG